MKSCRIHFLPALAGDCFVLEFINKECIIIDCGYKSTYENELKPLLLELKSKGCKVTLLLITHTDRDHIAGAIELIRDNGIASFPNIIFIENIWYNGIYNTLCFNPELKERIHSCSLDQQKKTEYYIAEMMSKMPDTANDISAKECIEFEKLCTINGYNLNACFSNDIVSRRIKNYAEKEKSAIQIGNCKITILSPSDNEILNLSKALHIDMLKTLGPNYAIDQNSGFIKLCELFLQIKSDDKVNHEETISATSEKIESWLGTSSLAEMNAVNKASIVVEIQFNNLKMLFTGDSESSLWYFLLDERYDVIKLSHHGTTKPNVKLLESTKGDKLLISTNGYRNNQHPEKDTIARIILSGNKSIYFNYMHPFKDVLVDNQKGRDYKVFFEQNIIDL